MDQLADEDQHEHICNTLWQTQRRICTTRFTWSLTISRALVWKINPRFVREVDSGRGTLWMDCRGAPGVCMLGASASACLLSFIIFFKKAKQTSLVAQRLRLHAQNAGGPGSIPRATTKISSVLQQGFTIPYAATKNQCSQINKNKP